METEEEEEEAEEEVLPATGRQWDPPLYKVTLPWISALDSYLVFCSSKHGIEAGVLIGQESWRSVKFHYLGVKQRKGEQRIQSKLPSGFCLS